MVESIFAVFFFQRKRTINEFGLWRVYSGFLSRSRDSSLLPPAQPPPLWLVPPPRPPPGPRRRAGPVRDGSPRNRPADSDARRRAAARRPRGSQRPWPPPLAARVFPR